MVKPRVRTGALVGGLAASAAAALLALGDALAGLPFLPFDVFDWAARVLPGGLIRAGIAALVWTLDALRISVREAAKTAEQIMALGLMIGLGVLLGAALFAALRALPAGRGRAAGALLGGGLGLAGAAISLSVNQTASAGPLVGALWAVLVGTGWGALTGWSYERLAALPSAPAGSGDAEAAPDPDRRRFLVRLGAGTAAVTVIGAGLSSVLASRLRPAAPPIDPALAPGGPEQPPGAAGRLARLPNADDPLRPAPGTRAEYTPLDEHYRIDINLRPPRMDGASWRLAITGLVDTPLSLTLGDLRTGYTPLHQFVTLSCISNPVGGDLISTTLWTGASLREVLAGAGLRPGARYLIIRSTDGFSETLSLDLVEADPRIMLAYAWDGQPLKQEHGFPLRIYIPDRYGMKQPKWITGIEVTDTYRDGYWVQRGWDEEALVRATSVVDTVAVRDAFTQGGETFIPVGGIAYAGARGISRVEVRVDDGEWVEAALRRPLSDTTWVIWRYDWPFREGQHTFAVRCVDGDGVPQIEQPQDVYPSGATGIHSLRG